jgi:outer membrane protein assembly factor BamD
VTNVTLSLKPTSVRRQRVFFPTLRAALLSGVAMAAMVCAPALQGQTTPDGQSATDTQTTTQTSVAQDGSGKPVQTVSTTTEFHRGKKKVAKVKESKDTRKLNKREKGKDETAAVDAKLPDKQLYDKALLALKKGRFDIARLDLQTMLNTYPDSQYQMRAKLAIADSWYKEGGTAALTQAESEYSDFRVFFPNAPEAAEAQMRIGDIYFKQMDKPDRDDTKALHAEEEYRRMLTDYPNAPPQLTAQATQRLRDVQEALATREAEIGAFYATRENWAAVIARYQTVVDTYPLYSRMDEVLIGLGDAYNAEAHFIRIMKLPEAAKAELEKLYDGKAAAAYREVVLHHAAAAHVEDAKDRLDAMNLPIPTPTPEEVAASAALENSRRGYSISDRAVLFFLHKPDTVAAAREGGPTLTDPRLVTAPEINKRVGADFKNAVEGKPAVAEAAGSTKPADEAADAATAAPGAPAVAKAPLALSDVTAEGTANPSDTTLDPTTAPVAAPAGNSLGVEILTPGVNGGSSANNRALPPVEQPGAAPDQPNEINAATPAAQAAPAAGKKAKAPSFDKSDESSSKHKKKKGLNKLNPL